ncbi:MAG: hypothetical protein HFJ95_09930 [Muribaculaceae bacterium]|nr:hypothetical protein [Muribaculaceae bacterium]
MVNRFIGVVPIVISLFSLFMCSCGNGGDTTVRSIRVTRLDSILTAGRMPEDSITFAAANSLFLVSGYGALNDSSLMRYKTNPSIALHAKAMGESFEDISDIEYGLGGVFAKMRKYYPDVTLPAVYSVVSPFNQSVFTVDTLLYIGLNHYLGVDYEPYGYFPDFVRKTKVRSRLLPDVAETLIRGEYGYDPGSNYPTLLSRMLYEGAVMDAVVRLTGKTEMEVLGYDEEEMRWLEDNEEEIWNALIIRKYLYSTDETVASRMIMPSAATSLLAPEVPGRAGRYIGYKIVKSYVAHNDIEPAQLLLPSFYDSGETLAASKYHH